jgi:hypothetical protein
MARARGILPAVLVAGLSIATTACARTTYDQRYPVFDSNDRTYYDSGLRDGRESGIDDARRGRSYDVTRHGEYRDNRRGNDSSDVRAFRAGFESGYDEGYRQYARGTSRSGYPSASTYPYPPPASSYPRSPAPYYGVYGGRYASAAADNGYRDGLGEGQHAAQHGDRFDPVGEKRYRDGDHNYKKQDGSRDEYKREYRAAFQQGYNEGYRGYRQ